MAKLWFVKVSRGARIGLIPTDDTARAAVDRLGDGECIEVEIGRLRSVRWHRMYFGICREIGHNQDPRRDESSIDYELRVLAGHYDVMYVGKSPAAGFLKSLLSLVAKGIPADIAIKLREVINELSRGHEVRVPKRIAFDKLSADEWAQLWPSIELAIREKFGEEYLREGRAA